ncbi:MAG: SIMPL domain-containing protein [Gammaproteobacteria bacterium]|nr:SIMPL domain-containing protein [Gammaproteobacteria bacterium]MBU1979823.1 SIMPL domain-containing protein [Gammaproteobacteria bacterium]
MNRLGLALATLLISTHGFSAGAADHANISAAPTVSLSASAMRTVQNDNATARLFVELEDSDATKASETVTVQANKAYSLLKNFPELKVKTAGHQAYPIWDKNRVTRWRVRHELLVEAVDFKTLSKAIGAVQPYAQLGGIQFSISGKLREATESLLIQEASTAFQKRADLIRQSFGAKAYRIKEIAVQSGEPSRIAPMFRAQMAAAGAEHSPPALEGGGNEISLTISGNVELTMP